MSLQEYRDKIEKIDEQLLKLFSERMETAAEIGAYKKENDLPVFVPEVEKKKLKKAVEDSPEELREYTQRLFSLLFELSRSYQDRGRVLHCGLLGRHLRHSFSPEIHAMLRPYEYALFEKEPEEVASFLRSGQWDGLNVTIPYKKEAYAAVDVLGKDAARAKSVNTIVRLPDGRLFGDSTDVYGFKLMVKHAGIDVSGKKVLVLGTGGASCAVIAALQDLNAGEIIAVSRNPGKAGGDFAVCGYEELAKHRDAGVIVNATPVGMYPDNGASPVDLSQFTSLTGVLDLIYNPCRTALLMQAEERHIPCDNGLYMLVAQAKKSAEIFTKGTLDDDLIGRIHGELREKLQNIALIGMPGAGKTTLAREISEKTGRTFYDTDEEITKRFGITPAELIRTRGEDAFREIETEVLADISRQSHAVIATGGGVVTRRENYPLLHQNSRIIWLKRDISELSTEDRPLSQAGALEELYEARRPLYEAFADDVRTIGKERSTCSTEKTGTGMN